MRIHTLDSLRGIFALMVVLLHFPAEWTFLEHPLVRNDGISVDFFFVLSGFVVSLIYSESLTNGRNFGNYMIRRFGRIWPLHVFVLLLFLGLDIVRFAASKRGLASDDAFFGQSDYWTVWFQDLLFFNAFRTEPSFHLNFPAWSIGAEFWTYVVFGLLVLTTRQWLPVAAAIAMAGCLSILLGYIDPGFGAAFGWALFRSIFFFLAGYAVWHVWKHLKDRALPVPSLVEVGTVIVVILAILYRNTLPVPPIAFAIIFGAAIVVFCFQAGIISRLLLTRPVLAIGERSYSIYLLHVLVMTVVGMALRITTRLTGFDFYKPGTVSGEPIDLLSLGPVWATNLAVAAMLLLIIWVSGLTYRYVELPGQKLARRLSQHLTHPAART